MTAVAIGSSTLGGLGRAILRAGGYFFNLLLLAYLSFRELFHLRGPSRKETFRVIYRQILFTGLDALPLLGRIALMIGLTVIVQAVTLLPQVGGEEMLGRVMVLVIVRELGPLLTAIVVVGRSGSAIATELGNMRVAQETDALIVMGISPIRLIILPRLVGVVLSVVCVTLYFDVIAIIGGFIIAGLKLTIPFKVFIGNILSALTFTDLFIFLIKSPLFGIIIASVCCYHGLSVRRSLTEVPQQTTKAIVNSIALSLFLNMIITTLVYL